MGTSYPRGEEEFNPIPGLIQSLFQLALFKDPVRYTKNASKQDLG